MEEHTYTIVGRPMSTTNSQMIVQVNVKGRPGVKRPMILKSKEARAWQDSAILQLRSQRKGRPPIEGPVDIHMDVFRAINAGDVDNFIKGCLDAVQQSGILRNDRLVMRISAEKFTDPKNPRYVVTVKQRPTDGVMFPLEEEEPANPL